MGAIWLRRLQVRSFLDGVSLLWCHHVLCLSLELRCRWCRKRWCQKRIRRHSHVLCIIYDEKMLDGSNSLNKGTPSCAIPPVLPPLLAACAPSAEFLLTVQSNVAEAFLATSTVRSSPGPDPELSTFWSNLQQHLIELRLWLDPGKGQPQQMGALSMLSALEQLDISCASAPMRCGQSSFPRLRNMSGECLTLKLPNLISLQLRRLERGHVVVSCRKLTEASFEETNSFCIEVDDAALGKLVLTSCEGTRLVLHSPEDQLKTLEYLSVSGCSEVGHHLIEGVAHMRQLQMLGYHDFPSECMPVKFPQSLRDVRLTPTDWSRDLPEGLKALHELTSLFFDSECNSWDITRPLAELLPLDGLKRAQTMS